MERLVMAAYRGAVLERIGSVLLVAFGQYWKGMVRNGQARPGQVRIGSIGQVRRVGARQG